MHGAGMNPTCARLRAKHTFPRSRCAQRSITRPVFCSAQASQKSVLITGCSSGIGKGLAVRLATEGWQVYAGVRTEAAAADLGKSSQNITPLILDVTKEGDVCSALAQVKAAQGDLGLTGLVNNAAYAFLAPVECASVDMMKATFDVNFFGTVRMVQAFLPLLRKSKDGRIINVSSVAGTWALPCWSPYSASKFAMEGLTDSLRVELKDQDIRVVLVKPPNTKTEIWASTEKYSQIAAEQYGTEWERYKPLLEKVQANVDFMAETGIDSELVVTTITTALTVANPRARYMVTPAAEFNVALRRIVPDSIADMLTMATMPTPPAKPVTKE